MLALAHSGSLDLPFLIPFGFFFPVVRLVDEVLGGDSSYSRCRFPSAEIPIPANRQQDPGPPGLPYLARAGPQGPWDSEP